MRKVTLIGTLSVYSIVTSTSFGQESSEKTEKKVEKIEVVGSRIKRSDIEGAQPIEVIDREAIQKTGKTNVADVLRDFSTASSFGGYHSEVALGETNAIGSNSVNLRGLGEKNTLVLLDGQRLPVNGVSGAVDLAVIPSSIIERIEILRDGASSIYGSDAVGGVVNIITKRGFDGINTSASVSKPYYKGGLSIGYDVVSGMQGDGVRNVTTLSYRKTEPMYYRDLYEIFGRGASMYAYPANYSVGGDDPKRSPDCPAENIRGDGLCFYDFSSSSQYYPKVTTVSVYSGTEWDVSPDSTFYFRLLTSMSTDRHNMAPNAAQFTIGEDVASTIDIPDYTSGNVTFYYRAVDLGTREHKTETNSGSIMAGYRTKFADTDVDFTLSQGYYNMNFEGLDGYARVSAIRQLISEGRFNPLKTSGNEAINEAAFKPWQKINTALTTADVKATGEFLDLPGGKAGYGFGLSFQAEKYKNTADEPSTQIDPVTHESDILGSSASTGSGDRSVSALWLEAVFPVIKDGEINASARYDQYSDFGSTVNPRVSVKYKPFAGLALRASTGTGFKAPPLRRMYQSINESYPYMQDLKYCRSQGTADADCAAREIRAFESGNKDLEEEKSKSSTFGFIFDPTNEISLGATYWMAAITGVVPNKYDYTKVMQADAAGVDFDSLGIKINRRADGQIDFIEAPLQNLGKVEAKGVDVDASLRYRIGVDRLSLVSSYSSMLTYKEESLPGLGAKERLGEYGLPRTKAVTSATYAMKNGFNATVRNRLTGNHRKTNRDEQVGSHSVGDLFLGLSLDQTDVSLGVNNVFNRKPPLDDSRASTDRVNNSLYDSLGRVITAGLSHNF